MNQNHIKNQENRFFFTLFCFWTFVLLCRPQDIFTFLAPIRPALVLGLFTFILFVLTKPGSAHHTLFKNKQVKLYIALICVMLLSIPFAIYRRAAFESIFLGYINVILFFFIFFIVVNTIKKLKTILLIGCLGTGLYWVFALMGGGDISGRLRFGSMFDPNDLAFFTLSLLPFNLIFLSKDNNWLKRFVCVINFVVGVLVILLTGSRGGFVGFLFVFLMLFFTKTITFRLPYKVVFAVLIMIIVLTGIIKIGFERYQSITDLKDDYNITAETGRKKVWETGIRVMLSHPLTGVGFECFGEAIGTDREERGLTPRWQAAHNSLIQIGAETGVIGFILFAIMSFKAFMIFGQVRKKAASEELVRIGEMAKVGFLGHFISAMFLSQAYSIYWAFYIVISAVLCNLLAGENISELSRNIKPRLLR
jgi:O-antigen ligase